MFTNKKLILAATVAAQSVLASNLLWFDDENEDNGYDPSLEGDDADLTEAEIDHDRRMLGKDRHDPNKRFYFHGSNNIYKESTRYEKMEDLWDQLVPDEDSSDVEPNPYWYAKFPEFFTQKA